MTEPTTQSDVKQTTTESSTVKTDVKPTDTTSSEGKDVKTQTLAEAVLAKVGTPDAAKSADESSAEAKAAEELRSNVEQNKEAEKTEDGGEKEESTTEKTETDDKVPEHVPYERFKEVNDKVQTYEQQLQQLDPVVKDYQNIVNHCTQYEITADQFGRMMRLQALMNTDPQAALKEILPLVDQLQGYVGDKLPTDLQAAVDKGDLTVAYAREVAQSRAKLQYGERRQQMTQQQVEKAQRDALVNQTIQAENAWIATKTKADADFKAKATANAPDGKWEEVHLTFIGLLNMIDAKGMPVNPVRTPNEYVALKERAYQMVNSRRVAKPATKKSLSSNGSSAITTTTAPLDPMKFKSAADFVKASVR